MYMSPNHVILIIYSVFFPTRRWIKFGDVDSIFFLGKDTVIMGFGNHLVFVDTSKPDKEDVIYHAVSDIRGDGVDCICAHRCLSCFAFSEKCRYPRIFIFTYPAFESIKIIEGKHADARMFFFIKEVERRKK